MSNPLPSKQQKRLSQMLQRNSMYNEIEMASGTSSMSGHSQHHHQHNNIDHHHDSHQTKEELRMKELEEARARLLQMEKTMKWWSDCTTNWREKWSKVRDERNKAREESRFLRNRLEAINKEIFVLKREKSEYECELTRFKELKVINVNDMTHDDANVSCDIPSEYDDQFPSDLRHDSAHLIKDSLMINNDNAKPKSHTLSGAELNDRDSFCDLLKGKALKCQNSKSAHHHRHLKSIPEFEHQLAKLRMKLEEANKAIESEKIEKSNIIENMEKLQLEYHSLKYKYSDIIRKKRSSNNSNNLNQSENPSNDKLSLSNSDPSDNCDTSNPYSRLIELRNELEKLQIENVSESEKLTLERDTRKLYNHISEFEEKLLNDQKSKDSDNLDVNALNNELKEKNKEFEELKNAHCKLKKVFQEKCSELSHAMRKAEQYESEAKKLRIRIEELKKDLASAEDEVDGATHMIRKLQNTNEQLHDQIGNFQVQLQQLQTKIHNSSDFLLPRNSNSSIDAELEVSSDYHEEI